MCLTWPRCGCTIFTTVAVNRNRACCLVLLVINTIANTKKALGMSKTLLELDVTGHGFGDVGCVPLGAALRQNRSIARLSYDHNLVTLEGFKAIRGCLYGNKKLVNVSAPVGDLAVSTPRTFSIV